jgi:hypothetical protein
MKKYIVSAAAAVFSTSTVLADNWDLGKNSVSVAIADVDWTVSPDSMVQNCCWVDAMCLNASLPRRTDNPMPKS